MDDGKVITLNTFRERESGSDLKALINMKKEIAKIKNKELREYFEETWCNGAKIASELFHPF